VARFFVQSGGGDVTFDPDDQWSSLGRNAKRACGSAPRTLSFVYRASATGPVLGSEAVTFANVNALWWTGAEPAPTTAARLGNVGFYTGPYCSSVTFGREAGSPDVAITETAAFTASGFTREWHVASQEPHMAYCQAQGRLVYLPSALVVRAKGPRA
jgi:hypothetical protein